MPHRPVLIDEVTRYLNVKQGGCYVDCTFGAGGYTKAILNIPETRVVALDTDQSVKQYAEGIELKYRDRFSFINTKFSKIDEFVKENSVDGIVLDAGVSSMQIDQDHRGFSFMREGLLDMRMDATGGPTAADIVNTYSIDELTILIKEYGEERFAKRIAAAICNYRKKQAIATTTELASIIQAAVPYYADGIHPATRTFQAIRIEVNSELKELEECLKNSAKLLKSQGRLVIVTFHSLEDKIVKNCFASLCGPKIHINKYQKTLEKDLKEFTMVFKGVVIPNKEEIKHNPRSRSAKLRVVEKI